MNIFFLDTDPTICASYHADIHLNKMIIESAQLLCTALNTVAGKQVTTYKSTHVNHPCAIWARQSYQNWRWLFNLMIALHEERKLRFRTNKPHATIAAMTWYENYVELAWKLLPNDTNGITPPALAMPDECKVAGTAVTSYRNYYRDHKKHLHKWTNREIPYWIGV